MVGTLSMYKIRRRLHVQTAVTLVTALMSVIATGESVETSITINQGTNIAVTAPAAFNHIAFDLSGRIWLAGDVHEPATPLTATGALNQRPVFSHDGRLIAYESLLSGYRQIFVTDVLNGESRQVTFGPYDHLAPAWSPTGKRLVMSSNRGGNFDIWEVDADNLELRQLTFTRHHERDPAWNDDGTRLAYITETTNGSSLYILSPGDEPRHVLHERERMAAPAWRPGGGLLTYTRLDRQTNQLRMLILSTPPITKPITRQEQVSPRPAHWIDHMDFLYTADGKIRRRELGLPEYDDFPFSVRIDIKRDVRSTRDTALFSSRNRSVYGFDGRTERADGRQIVAALSDLWEFQRNSDGRLTLIRQLTNDAFIDTQPAFSPDGQHLAFISDRSGLAQVWIIEHGTLKKRRLTGDRAVTGALTWSPDGTSLAYLVMDEDDPGDHVYRLRQVEIGSGRWRTLSATSRFPGTPDYTDDTWTIDAAAATSDTNPAALPLSWRPASNNRRYIVRAGRIFDGIGPEYADRQEIVIEDGLIVAIRPWSDTGPDIPVIDAGAHTVIPGLIDLATRQEPAEDERTGRKWLAAGVTTIRTTIHTPMGRTDANFNRALERFESWSSGRRSGPRMMITVRPCHESSGRLNQPWFERLVTNAEKYNVVAIELCPGLTGELLTDTIRRARESGLSVIATTPVPGMTPGADELRPDALLSADGDRADPVLWSDFLLVSGTAGAIIPSHLLTTPRPGHRMLDGLNSSWQYRKIFTASEQRRFNGSRHSMRMPIKGWPFADPNRILGNGGGIIIGSEAPLMPQGLGLHSEMRRLADGGLQPFQIMKMASLDAARNLGYGESLGLIRIGRQADIVILNGDPLENIDSAANVVGTIVNGRYFSRKDLTTPGLRARSVGNFYNSVRR